MKHLNNMLYAFAVAGTVAGSAVADDSQQTTQPRHFADMRTTGVNRELSHAPIYGTFYDEASAEAYRKTPSKYMLNLNGTWKFQLFGSPEKVPDAFNRPGFEDAEWLDMTVPSNWQNDMRVPDRGIYTRDVYLFQKGMNPPLLPEANPTGCYRRTFEVPAEALLWRSF